MTIKTENEQTMKNDFTFHFKNVPFNWENKTRKVFDPNFTIINMTSTFNK